MARRARVAAVPDARDSGGQKGVDDDYLFSTRCDRTSHGKREAAEIRLRAERKAGQVLIEMGERGERTDRGHNTKLELRNATPTLADLGVTKTQSHRWQEIAKVPERVFEKYIEDGRK
jgi:hypothetical protein